MCKLETCTVNMKVRKIIWQMPINQRTKIDNRKNIVRNSANIENHLEERWSPQ